MRLGIAEQVSGRARFSMALVDRTRGACAPARRAFILAPTALSRNTRASPLEARRAELGPPAV